MREAEREKRETATRALSPRSFLLLKQRFQPTPSPLCGMASWPLPVKATGVIFSYLLFIPAETPDWPTTIAAALLSPRRMQIAVSMEKPPGTCFLGGGANGPELRRSMWLEAGSVRQRQRRRAKTGPTAAPCTTITAALLPSRCMQIAVSMEGLPGTCLVPKGRFRGGLGQIS